MPSSARQPSYSDRARQAFKTFVERRYGARDMVAFLGGSVAKGTAIEGSDADGVIILADGETPRGTRQQTVVDGIPLDIGIYNMAGLKHRLAQEHKGANPYVMETLATGDVVANPRSPLAREAQRNAGQYWQDGPAALRRSDQRSLRVEISELAEKIHSTTDHAEGCFLASMMMPKLAHLHLRLNGQWTGSGRKLLTRLRDHDPDYAQRLHHAVHVALSTKADKFPLLGMVQETLKPVGGLTRRGFAMLEKTPQPVPPPRHRHKP